MKTEKLNNPYVHPIQENTLTNYAGMTLRDYFANSAIQGMLSSYDPSSSFDTFKHSAEDLARTSFLIADEMLKQRELC